MTRMSKKGERKARYPRKRKKPSVKTGPLKESIAFKAHVNALDESSHENLMFIPKG